MVEARPDPFLEISIVRPQAGHHNKISRQGPRERGP